MRATLSASPADEAWPPSRETASAAEEAPWYAAKRPSERAQPHPIASHPANAMTSPAAMNDRWSAARADRPPYPPHASERSKGGEMQAPREMNRATEPRASAPRSRAIMMKTRVFSVGARTVEAFSSPLGFLASGIGLVKPGADLTLPHGILRKV